MLNFDLKMNEQKINIASDNFFNDSIVNTILYRAFDKPFIIEIFKQLIGLSQLNDIKKLGTVSHQ